MSKESFNFDLNTNLADLIREAQEFSREVDIGVKNVLSSARTLKEGQRLFLKESMTKLKDGMIQAQEEIIALETKIHTEHLDKAMLREVEHAKEVAENKLKTLKEQFDKEMDLGERRKKALEESSKNFGEKLGSAAQNFGEAMHGVFSDLSSKDISMFSSLLSKAAAATQKAHEKAEMGAQAGGGVANILSKITGTLGPALTAIAAAAAGIAAVVKIFLDANAQAVEFNQALLGASIAGGDLANRAWEVSDAFSKAREAAVDSFSFTRIWGIDAKEHYEIWNAYQEGRATLETLKEQFSDVADEQEKLRKATEKALTYSKLFGSSATEIAKMSGDYMGDLGLTLEGVERRFSMILSAARESGFGVKTFFSAVSQATSGMSIYNVRLHEAASIFTDLGKVLGAGDGAAFLQRLMSGFKHEGVKDATTNVMKFGVQRSLDIAKLEYQFSTQEFVKKVDEWVKNVGTDSAEAEDIRELLSVLRLQEGPEAVAEALANMTRKQQSLLIYEVQRRNEDLSNSLFSLVNLSGVAKKGAGLGAAVAARSELGPAATLLTMLEATVKETGLRIDQINPNNIPNQIRVEQATGMAGEELKKWIRVGQDYSSQFSTLESFQKRIRGSKDDDEITALVEEFNKEYSESMGVILDETGARFRAVKDKEGKIDFKDLSFAIGDSFREFIMTKGQELADFETDPDDKKFAQQIVSNTTEMTKILSQGIQWLLQQIWKGVEKIKSFFGLGSKEQMSAKAKVQAQYNDEILQRNKELSENNKKIGDLQQVLAKTKDAGEREKAQAEIKGLEEERERLLQEREEVGSRSEALSNLDLDTMIGDKTVEELFGKRNLRTAEGWERAVRLATGQVTKGDYDKAFKDATDAADRVANSRFMWGGARQVAQAEGLAKETARVYDSEFKWESRKEEMLEQEAIDDKRSGDVLRKQEMADDKRSERELRQHKTITEDQTTRLLEPYEKERQGKIADMLHGMGFAPEDALAKARKLMMSGDGFYQISTTDDILRDYLERNVGTQTFEDGFISAGGRMARISEGDHVMAFKDGGPVSKALGGGRGVTINAAFSGIGPRDTLAVLNNALRTGMLRIG